MGTLNTDILEVLLREKVGATHAEAPLHLVSTAKELEKIILQDKGNLVLELYFK